MHCPVFDRCRSRTDGELCTDLNQDKLNGLIASDEQFQPGSPERARPCRLGVMPFVERLALRQLKKGNAHHPPVPTHLASLVDEDHPIEVRAVRLKACCAATWRLQDGWVIQVTDTASPSRNRVAVFHEAFHILAHSRSTAVPVFSKRGATQGRFNELMADYFAICMLMPGDWVQESWAEVRSVDRMAEAFEVPPTAMWLRLREFDLID